MNYQELLNTPEFRKQLDQQIIAHINKEFGRLGLDLPLPKFRDNVLVYDDPRICKLVDRFRTGAGIVMFLMDRNEEQARKANAQNKAST
jgi:hypothetical protein